MFCLPISSSINMRAINIFPGAKQADQSWEYINRSQTHERRNWERGQTISFLEIYKPDFWYNAVFKSAVEQKGDGGQVSNSFQITAAFYSCMLNVQMINDDLCLGFLLLSSLWLFFTLKLLSFASSKLQKKDIVKCTI